MGGEDWEEADGSWGEAEAESDMSQTPELAKNFFANLQKALAMEASMLGQSSANAEAAKSSDFPPLLQKSMPNFGQVINGNFPTPVQHSIADTGQVTTNESGVVAWETGQQSLEEEQSNLQQSELNQTDTLLMWLSLKTKGDPLFEEEDASDSDDATTKRDIKFAMPKDVAAAAMPVPVADANLKEGDVSAPVEQKVEVLTEEDLVGDGATISKDPNQSGASGKAIPKVGPDTAPPKEEAKLKEVFPEFGKPLTERARKRRLR